jgi:hypothetical protein
MAKASEWEFEIQLSRRDPEGVVHIRLSWLSSRCCIALLYWHKPTQRHHRNRGPNR